MTEILLKGRKTLTHPSINSDLIYFLLVISDLITERFGSRENKVRTDESLSSVKVQIDQDPSGIKVGIDQSLNLNEHALGEDGGKWFSSSNSSSYSSSSCCCCISTVVVTEIIRG